MPMLTTQGLEYLTADLPGIGGAIKQRPDDFVVREIPAVEPSGSGEYLHLLVEKKQRLTTDVVRLFSEHFRVPWEAIGFAGLKDKRAVTRQWFSVRGATEDHAVRFADTAIGVLDMVRHDRPLRRGDLAGNAFGIKVRHVTMAGVIRARNILQSLERTGAANFVGAQRFGYRDDNHVQGLRLLKGEFGAFVDEMLGGPIDREPERVQEARRAYERGDLAGALELWPTVHRFERQVLGPLTRGAAIPEAIACIDAPHRQLMVSAFQSAIFNGLLNERLKAGHIGTLLVGDVALDHLTGATFLVADPAAQQRRADALEISPTGPMWGPGMKRAQGAIEDRELEALHETGLRESDLASGPYKPDGLRRPYRMPVGFPQVHGGGDEHGPFVHVSFELPRGSFATAVLREIMKG